MMCVAVPVEGKKMFRKASQNLLRYVPATLAICDPSAGFCDPGNFAIATSRHDHGNANIEQQKPIPTPQEFEKSPTPRKHTVNLLTQLIESLSSRDGYYLEDARDPERDDDFVKESEELEKKEWEEARQFKSKADESASRESKTKVLATSPLTPLVKHPWMMQTQELPSSNMQLQKHANENSIDVFEIPDGIQNHPEIVSIDTLGDQKLYTNIHGDESMADIRRHEMTDNFNSDSTELDKKTQPFTYFIGNPVDRNDTIRGYLKASDPVVYMNSLPTGKRKIISDFLRIQKEKEISEGYLAAVKADSELKLENPERPKDAQLMAYLQKLTPHDLQILMLYLSSANTDDFHLRGADRLRQHRQRAEHRRLVIGVLFPKESVPAATLSKADRDDIDVLNSLVFET